MTALLVLSACLGVTYVGAHELCERAAVRLRLARHRRLTRRHGEMLKRALGGAR